LFEEIKKFLAIEKSKLEEAKKKAVLIEKNKAKAEAKKSKAQRKKRQSEVPVKVGTKVRLIKSNQRGEVVGLEGNEATVMFGNFKTQVDIKKLLVE